MANPAKVIGNKSDGLSIPPRMNPKLVLHATKLAHSESHDKLLQMHFL
jgi:hypothetical protein